MRGGIACGDWWLWRSSRAFAGQASEECAAGIKTQQSSRNTDAEPDLHLLPLSMPSQGPGNEVQPTARWALALVALRGYNEQPVLSV